MTKAALLAVALAACTDGIAAPHETPTTPIPTDPTSYVDGAPLVVATGGAATVVIHDKTSIGLSASASDGYRVSPFELDRWPNTISPEYWIRAQTAGAGSYEIVTSKGIATGLVHSADVARVSIYPASYHLDGKSQFAFATNRTDFQVALHDAERRRLVDATLAISAAQAAWDRAALPAIAGRHTITVTADSFGERTFEIEVVDGADRIESVREGDRTCFHAYRGTTEVVAAMTIDGGTPDPRAQNCAVVADPSGLRASF